MKIFIVEDDVTQRMILIEQLGQTSHDLVEFASGKEMLAARDEAPDLILLDIEMPGMDGISACRAWRDAGEGATQIIFISAHDDLDTRLKAYDAGGNDFVIKPFDAPEIQKKVQVAEATLQQKQTWDEQAQFAGKTAFTALSTLGEMGVIQQFMRDSFAVTSAEPLVTAMFNTLQHYGLPALIEIRSGAAPRQFSPGGSCTPLEVSLLQHASTMDRIFQFRDRLVINYPAVTLLVHSLPLDDPDRVGRLRDHLAVLVESAHMRMVALEIAQTQAAQQTGITDALDQLTDMLENIDERQAMSRLHAEEISSSYLHDLTELFANLGLSDDQEDRLVRLANQAHAQFAAQRDADSLISNQLQTVKRRLSMIVGN